MPHLLFANWEENTVLGEGNRRSRDARRKSETERSWWLPRVVGNGMTAGGKSVFCGEEWNVSKLTVVIVAHLYESIKTD